MSDEHIPGLTDLAAIADRIKKIREEGGDAIAFGVLLYKHESIDVEAALRAVQPEEAPNALPADILAVCRLRRWNLHWTHRGVYLHLEASELIEALRGKRGPTLDGSA